jgi:chemotaxis family two-component system response regulator Rcp1
LVFPQNILLIEDSLSDADLTAEALSESKVLSNLHWVADGVEALCFLHQQGEYIDSHRDDVILLDLNLPKKNGYEILAQIKADPNLKLIPVIILTTSAAESDIFKTYKLNANCYITKPIDFEQYIDAVKLIELFWLSTAKLPSVD